MPVTEVDVGARHACARVEDRVYCWGANGNGQLGLGDTDPRSLPTLVPTLSGIGAIGLGSDHSCAIVAASGAVYCWGANGDAQAGDTGRVDRHAPARVTIVSGEFWRVEGGGEHTCVSRRAGDEDYCFGSNAAGQLSGTVPNLGRYAMSLVFAPGGEHTCALDTGDSNQLYCWGRGTSGQLGDGASTDRSAFVALIDGVQAIAAGAAHTCGISAGALFCWGRNDQGQVRGASGSNVAAPNQVTTFEDFTHVTAGTAHTCALRGGVAYCFGSNAEGALGRGPDGSGPSADAVALGLTYASIRAGDQFTCAVSTEGALYCWGANGSGQLGLGDASARAEPTRVCIPPT
jgi:alpha-tubulin suppressor-like RCC1 family protein